MTIILVLLILTANTSFAAPRAHKEHVFHPIGHRTQALPKNYASIRVGGSKYFYQGGIFYRKKSGGYIVVAAPIGARVTNLPVGFVTVRIGLQNYFYINDTYYWKYPSGEYVVVEKHQNADAALTALNQSEVIELLIYPKEGQSEELVDRDRYECHRWAVDQTGFDPSLMSESINSYSEYNRAMTACLEGRGYVVK